MNDPYLYPGSFVLKNKFGLKDQSKLSLIEEEIYQNKSLLPLPVGNFNYNYLKALHKHLFCDIYDWAGEPRVIPMSKSFSEFAKPLFIEPEINKIFSKLKKDVSSKLNHQKICEVISKYFNEINAVHPFREGNGRVNRLFFSQLAKKYGYYINWSKMDKDLYLDANITGMHSADYEPLKRLLLVCTFVNKR